MNIKLLHYYTYFLHSNLPTVRPIQLQIKPWLLVPNSALITAYNSIIATWDLSAFPLSFQLALFSSLSLSIHKSQSCKKGQ